MRRFYRATGPRENIKENLRLSCRFGIFITTPRESVPICFSFKPFNYQVIVNLVEEDILFSLALANMDRLNIFLEKIEKNWY